MTNESIKIDEGSFRDRAGFVFYKNGEVYRQINRLARTDYDLLIDSGLYKYLVDKKYLISHEEVVLEETNDGYKTIKPELVKNISYPYEWSFSQLKDSALLTIKIQKVALDYGMSLKDASGFNIQFHKGRPIFIDTLSFEKYKKGSSWIAYRQFCQHFIAPLLLMRYKDIRMGTLLKSFIDGIPLDITSSLLSFWTKLKIPILIHIVVHAKTQKAFSDKKINKKRGISLNSQKAIIESLENLVKKIQFKKSKTEWGEYYSFANYNDNSIEDKKSKILSYLELIKPKTVLDLGANNGYFSRIASNKKINTISTDIDLNAVEKNYLGVVKEKEENILPLFLDLFNPSPSLGWANEERPSFFKRNSPDLIFSLALIHHLSITNNLPFEKVAKRFSSWAKYLIIEFVPLDDSNAAKLVQNREDDLSWYNEKSFEKAFGCFFEIVKKDQIKESKRTIFFMKTL